MGYKEDEEEFESAPLAGNPKISEMLGLLPRQDFGAPTMDKMAPPPQDFGPPTLDKMAPAVDDLDLDPVEEAEEEDTSAPPAFDSAKYLQNAKDAKNEKDLYGTLGILASGFQNIPRASETLFGHKNVGPDIAGSFNQMAKDVVNPNDQQMNMYKAYTAAKAAEQAEIDTDLAGEANDPESDSSKRARSMIDAMSPGLRAKMGDEAFEQITAAQVKNIMDMNKESNRIIIADKHNEAWTNNTNTKAAAKIEATKLTREGMMNLAGLRIDQKNDALEAAAVQKLTNDPYIIKLTQNLGQAKKDQGLVYKFKKEGITGVGAHELVQSYVSLLKGMSGNSVGQERADLQNAAEDAEQKYGRLMQKIQLKGFYKYQDLPFLSEIESSVRGLHGTMQADLRGRIESKTRDSKLPGVNKAQADAGNKMMDASNLPAPDPNSDMVTVRAKDGTIGKIPRANLQKAKDRGAEEVKQ